MSFELQDLYAVGLGFDLVGAVLLALGLVANNLAELNRIAGSFYGSNPYQAVAVARDRINAMSGVALLLLGFLVEAAAFLLLLARARPVRSGHQEVVAAFVVMIVALCLGWVSGRIHGRLRLGPTVVKMTRFRLDGSLMDFPAANAMPDRARAMGYTQQQGEDELDFVRRTLGIQNMVVSVNANRERLYTDPPLPGE